MSLIWFSHQFSWFLPWFLPHFSHISPTFSNLFTFLPHFPTFSRFSHIFQPFHVSPTFSNLFTFLPHFPTFSRFSHIFQPFHVDSTFLPRFFPPFSRWKLARAPVLQQLQGPAPLRGLLTGADGWVEAQQVLGRDLWGDHAELKWGFLCHSGVILFVRYFMK